MSIKLQIQQLELKNFLSYGSEVVKLEIANLGPVLILGDLIQEETGRSNGAGKSTLVTAIVWCLFGRTINNPSPGDKIINWDNGKDCFVKLTTKDQWEITRTRNVDGHSELLLFKDNIDCTKSTNQNAQAFLDELFGLDYDIFISSVFCGQFGKSFLEMTSAKRKEAIERVLGLDRVNVYAEKLKNIYQAIETEQKLLRNTIDNKLADVSRQITQIDANSKSLDEHNASVQTKIDKLQQQLAEAERSKGSIKLPDLDGLVAKWTKYETLNSQVGEFDVKIAYLKDQMVGLEKLNSALSKKTKTARLDIPPLDVVTAENEEYAQSEKLRASNQEKIVRLTVGIQSAKMELGDLTIKIMHLKDLGGTTCDNCQQEVVVEHTSDIVQKLFSEKSFKEKQLVENEAQLTQLRATKYARKPTMAVAEAQAKMQLNARIDAELADLAETTALNLAQIQSYASSITKTEVMRQKAQAIVIKKKPMQTIYEAKEIIAERQKLDSNCQVLLERLDNARSEINPYNKIIKDLTILVAQLQDDIKSDESKMVDLDKKFQHYKYLYRAYSDRKMIKGWLLAELIPYLNTRISYYLTSFGLDLHITFDSALADSTDRWDYDFCSGGERKRIDLAIMFALYDLYVSIYGQQCNVMVLDEVDSRLDQQGVSAFAEIVHDMAKSSLGPSTVFVISHKCELKDLFATQLVIKKEDGFSKVEGLYSKDIV